MEERGQLSASAVLPIGCVSLPVCMVEVEKNYSFVSGIEL
jgi:hypothetical protein